MLCYVMLSVTGLARLSLRRNRIGPVGGAALLAAVEANAEAAEAAEALTSPQTAPDEPHALWEVHSIA